MNKGKLYLIPTILGKETQDVTLPSTILKYIKEIDIFIVENLRTARRHIKKIYREKDIDATTFYSYGKHDTLSLEEDFLPHILSGQNVGLLSEAGLPCIADPGSKIVEYAHNFQIDVVPFVGPSSILLALMASGMNGQNFAFTGYLFDTIIKVCSNNTKLCIASDITLPSENIKTKTIAEWKQEKININKKPAIFLIN